MCRGLTLSESIRSVAYGRPKMASPKWPFNFETDPARSECFEIPTRAPGSVLRATAAASLAPVVSRAMLSGSDRGRGRLRLVLSVAVCSLLVGLSACAAAPMSAPTAPPSQSPEAPAAKAAEAPAPTSLSEAQAQIDQAIRELQGSGGAEKKADRPDLSRDKSPPAPPPEPSPATGAGGLPRPSPDDETSTKVPKPQSADGAKGTSQRESPCAHACRAFHSLHRAVDAVCRLAGDPSEECQKAREKESQNTPRVASCGCAEATP
jgi:hypothetical protein